MHRVNHSIRIGYFLNKYKVILASASPRRADILENNMGLMFEVVPSKFNEDLEREMYTPAEYVEETCRRKALEVETRVKADIILSFDTIVVCDEKILEKPENHEQAKKMLTMLSGRSHVVLTGCTFLFPGKLKLEPVTFHAQTIVTFGSLDDLDIDLYVATNDPMDKAGSYGIQGLAAQFIQKIDGCFYNVMGLPVFEVSKKLSQLLKEYL